VGAETADGRGGVLVTWLGVPEVAQGSLADRAHVGRGAMLSLARETGRIYYAAMTEMGRRTRGFWGESEG
jgi:hypothetical protein